MTMMLETQQGDFKPTQLATVKKPKQAALAFLRPEENSSTMGHVLI